MKKISLLLYFSILATVGFAQQFPLQSQYQFNYSTINPANVGENDFYSARVSFRDQWVGFTETPNATQIFTLTKGYGVNGLGLTVFNDHTGGLYTKSGASLSYSHKVRLSKSELSFGLAAGAAKVGLDANDDPSALYSDVIPEFTFGAFYKIGNLNLGISVPGLLNVNMEIANSDDNRIYSHLYSMISYKHKLNDTWDIYPSLLIKTTANHNQIDANVNFKLRNKLWIGTSYRQDFGATIYVGIDFGRLFSIYSYDVSTNEVSPYSTGSHEFTLGYDFIPEEDMEKEKEEERKMDEELFDKDKDGVDDKYDLCPDVAGDKLANGCPDFDKDGVPDKFDLCPNLFGDVNAQGCPELSTNESSIIAIALENLFFGFDKDIINSDSYTSLTSLAVLLHKNPSMFLLIEGYASSEGSIRHNLNLSARRAKAVQEFFTQKGIDKNRLVLDFHGEKNPVNTNNTEKERAENRRVEFDIKYHLHNTDAANILQAEYDSLLNQMNTVLKGQDKITITNNTILTNKSDYELKTESSSLVLVEEDLETELIDSINTDDNDLVAEYTELIDSNIKDDNDLVSEDTELIDPNIKDDNNLVSEDTEFIDPTIKDDNDLVAEDTELLDPIITENNDLVVKDTELSDPIRIDNDISLENTAENKYLVIVEVFSNLANAINSTVGTDLNYLSLNGKYYVYAFASRNRKDAEQFRSVYKNGCWILDPK